MTIHLLKMTSFEIFRNKYIRCLQVLRRLGFKHYSLKSCVRSVTRFCWAKLLLTRNIRHFLPQRFCNILEVGHLLQFTSPALMSQEEIYELLSSGSQQCKDMQMHCHCSKPHFYSFRPLSKVHCARSWRRLSLGVNTRVCRVCVKMTPGPGPRLAPGAPSESETRRRAQERDTRDT